MAAFGRRLNWRTGDATALAAARSLSARWLREQQISVDLAAQWALFYINEKQRNRRNPSAAGRARFLIKTIALLQSSQSATADEFQETGDLASCPCEAQPNHEG